jgi:RHS repeat-associated protein
VVDQRWINGSGTDVDRYQYGYDRDGNRLYKDNKVLSSLSEVYTYDSLNQIASYKLGTLNSGKTDVTGSPSNSQSWDYDAVGNWDSVTNSTTQTRSANKQNEITSVSGATTPAYDSNGNLTTDENNYRFAYDAWNRLVQVKNSSNVVIVTYGRDALHRHVTDTVGSTVTDRFFSSDWQLLETKVGSNTVTRNVWSPVYVDGLVLRDRDTDANGTFDERLYSLQDANWNTTGLVNAGGTVQERYTYTPFGQVTFRDGSGSTLSNSAKDWVFLHQGGEKIAAGDYEFRNRVYNPNLGRWLSNDPLRFNAGDQNWYRAIGNNPGNDLDPEGLWSWSGAFGGILGGGVAGASTGAVAGLGLPVVGSLGGAAIGGGLGIIGGFIGGGLYGETAVGGWKEKPETSGLVSEEFVGGLSIGVTTGAIAGVLGPFAVAVWPAILPAAKNLQNIEGKDVRFAQQGISQTFRNGEFAGKKLEEVITGLKEGVIKAEQLPIQVVIRERVPYTINNRSLMALREAGLQPTIIKNVTGDPFFEGQLTDRLREIGNLIGPHFRPVRRQ